MISVLIPVWNESHNIEAALESVQWADEILVVDSHSEDDTLAKAQAFGVRVLQYEFNGIAKKKNWAIPQATHEWVFILDADERVSEALQKEIVATVEQGTENFDVFWIKRQNIFMGKKIRYSGWQGDAVVRLIRRDKARYEERQVHEEIQTEGLRVGHLQAPLVHYTFRSLSHYLEKTERYARWSAQDHAATTPRVTLFHLLVKPAFRFFKHFVLQRGFLDGKTGLVVSAVMAWGVFLRYVFLMEMRKKT